MAGVSILVGRPEIDGKSGMAIQPGKTGNMEARLSAI